MYTEHLWQVREFIMWCFRVITAAMISVCLISVSHAQIKSGYGYVEEVYLMPDEALVPAKLDTGAGVSSVSADNIQVYKKDDKQYVRFELVYKTQKGKAAKIDYDLPLKGEMHIKNRAGESDDQSKYTRRFVVTMPICFDGKIYQVEANLTDRQDFLYPVLLGRRALNKMNVVVDPGQRRTFTPVKCVFKEQNATQVKQEIENTTKAEPQAVTSTAKSVSK
ncbi:ATP-dependent zinc protease family protein [Facilibium subflavum]|uniref:ATP-dependent zinc protease family protein n=1 Tax=Facilibium subflavum TaxID=2219058 RepID=UPI000E64FF59|nr:RimK/LysX family protein [Facilibium subflavum]